MFPGVIGTAPGRVTSVIGANHHEIVVTQLLEQFRQALIERLQRFRITIHITTVSVEHVEIYKVSEHDRSVRCTCQRIQRRVEKCLIPRRLDLPTDALVRINVRDLANTDHFTPAFNQLVEECRRRRWCRQITAIAGTNEIHSIGADEWPRNNATDVVVVN